MGPKHHQNFERQHRSLAKQFDVRFERVQSEEQRGVALAQLITLHNLRWKERSQSEAFCAPALLAFHDAWSRLALERGWLRLFVMRLDGEAAAALYGFRYGRTFYFFQSGFDPRFGNKHSLGHLTLGLSIKNAIEEGAQEFDMLHGAEPYKFRWARETRELGRLELYPPGARGEMYRGTMQLSRVARRLARRLLPGSLADRIAIGGQIARGGGQHVA
jgi:CelD/BcsL family acetyltransferase involved in cellulose biosynthesis